MMLIVVHFNPVWCQVQLDGPNWNPYYESGWFSLKYKTDDVQEWNARKKSSMLQENAL